MSSPRQLGLFEDIRPANPRRKHVEPAIPSKDVRAVAGKLPPQIYLGTSSWSFPGWQGIVYADGFSTAKLAREGLRAYASHPLLRSVGVDRTYYAPIDADAFRNYADQVPDDFRFLVKAHDVCTLPRFPDQPRYAKAVGEKNELFLNPRYASDEVVGPYLEGLGEKAGVLLFQFTPLDAKEVGGPDSLAERLHSFLDGLPSEGRYAVELRNPSLLNRNYLDALKDKGAVHCLNAHPSMPPVRMQSEIEGALAGDAVVVRWMLYPRYAYQQAKNRYQPFNRLVDEDAATRSAVVGLAKTAVAEKRPLFVIANNKAEGSAPLSLIRLAGAIVEDQIS